MNNYNTTLLNFYSNTEIIGDLLASCIHPNGTLLSSNKGLFFALLLQGTFRTNKSLSFLNDFIARMYLTFGVSRVELEKALDLFDTTPKELKTLCQSNQLKSLENIKEYCQKQNFDYGYDKIFWALKAWAIDNIRANRILNYYEFEAWGMNNFLGGKKSKSDIRCKCRSIYNYYEKRDWEVEKTIRLRKTKNEEELKMTRQEQAKKMAQGKLEQSTRKVLNMITGLLSSEYKKESGKWNITKIAEELKMSRTTVTKIIQSNPTN